MKGIGGSSVDKGTEVWIRGLPGRKLGMVAVNCYYHWEKFPELCRESCLERRGTQQPEVQGTEHTDFPGWPHWPNPEGSWGLRPGGTAQPPGG